MTAPNTESVRLAANDATPSAADRARWDEIQRLFEICRERPRDEWHRILREQCGEREGLAFEVMTLLVADEQLPPLEPDPS